MKTLRKGCRGSEVKTLQGYLNMIQDGIFGVLTKESVKQFQSSRGLTADGYIKNESSLKGSHFIFYIALLLMITHQVSPLLPFYIY